eukprot:m.148949 g.148949  ORF g.148949 m.148949 type:complete len:312 (-) comp15063_c6_seq1:34-969(-)
MELFEDGHGLMFAATNAREEAEFLHNEVFVQRAYLQGGLTLKDGDCIVDVGANIGLFSLFCAHEKKDLVLVAVEPAREVFELLRLNLQSVRAHNTVILEHCALVDEHTSGNVRLTYFPSCPGESTRHPAERTHQRHVLAAHSAKELENLEKIIVDSRVELVGKELGESALESLGDERAKRLKTDCEDGEGDRAGSEAPGLVESVAAMSLSALLAKHSIPVVDFLKIDCEGDELNVLLGLEDTDAARVRQIAVEVHDTDGRLERVCERLASWGFVVAVAQQRSGLVGGYVRCVPRALALYYVFARRVDARGD